MAGLTDKGFEVKDLSEVISELRAEASGSFKDLAPDGEIVDTSDSSVLGRLTRLVAPSLSDLWEAAQDVYSAFDPDTATGISLDNLVKYSRMTRRLGEASTVTIKLVAEEGTILPENSSVGGTGSQRWRMPPSLSFAKEVSSNGANISFGLLPLGEEIEISFSVAGISYKAVTEVTVDEEEDLLALTNKVIDSFLMSTDVIHAKSLGEGLITVERVNFLNDTLFSTKNCTVVDIIRTATATSVEKDRVMAYAGEINKIETPVLGWKSVVNPEDAIIGRPRETDEELRTRFSESKYSIGFTSADAIFSKLKGLNGVRDVALYENNLNIEDQYGLPAHSFKAIVLGGGDKDIAQTIWDNRPLGIKSSGNTEVEVRAVDGRLKSEWFERPVEVPIQLKITLSKEYNFPESGVSLMKSRLSDYFNNNYRIGEDVYYSKLFTPINSVEGHSVALLQLSRKGDELSYNNLILGYNEVAIISQADIDIEVL